MESKAGFSVWFTSLAVMSHAPELHGHPSGAGTNPPKRWQKVRGHDKTNTWEWRSPSILSRWYKKNCLTLKSNIDPVATAHQNRFMMRTMIQITPSGCSPTVNSSTIAPIGVLPWKAKWNLKKDTWKKGKIDMMCIYTVDTIFLVCTNYT